MDTIRMGQFLAELRRERRLTQEALAERLGVTDKTVSRWETGRYPPPVDMLLALSRLYGVSVDELVEGRRLPSEATPPAAEEAPAGPTAAFTPRERLAYWQRKWRREHPASLIAIILLAAAPAIVGVCVGRPWLAGATPAVATIGAFWRRGRMTAYAEARVFDGE